VAPEETAVAKQLLHKHVPLANKYTGNNRRTGGCGVFCTIRVVSECIEKKAGHQIFLEASWSMTHDINLCIKSKSPKLSLSYVSAFSV
jgi:hypothetical protein